MMHKFSKTGEYAKKRLKIALAEDRSAISASDNMAQIKKEIKSVIQRHMNINDEGNIFAGDLFDMYKHYAEKQGWTVEINEEYPSEAGGYSLISFTVHPCFSA